MTTRTSCNNAMMAQTPYRTEFGTLRNTRVRYTRITSDAAPMAINARPTNSVPTVGPTEVSVTSDEGTMRYRVVVCVGGGAVVPVEPVVPVVVPVDVTVPA